jgi:hypothetical protein
VKKKLLFWMMFILIILYNAVLFVSNEGTNKITTFAIQEEIEYYCEWSWPQKIINMDTKEVLYSCPSSKPYCNRDAALAGNPKCCEKGAVDGYPNCVDADIPEPTTTVDDPCDGVICPIIELVCPDGFKAGCDTECNPSTGQCTSCDPDCAGHMNIDLCAGVVCEDLEMLCGDGFKDSCTQNCNSGVCVACVPDCAGHDAQQADDLCAGVVCADIEKVCDDGFKASCNSFCMEGTCTMCTPDCAGHGEVSTGIVKKPSMIAVKETQNIIVNNIVTSQVDSVLTPSAQVESNADEVSGKISKEVMGNLKQVIGKEDSEEQPEEEEIPIGDFPKYQCCVDNYQGPSWSQQGRQWVGENEDCGEGRVRSWPDHCDLYPSRDSCSRLCIDGSVVDKLSRNGYCNCPEVEVIEEEYECRGQQAIKDLSLGEVVHTCSNPKRYCRITESGTVPKCCGKFLGYFTNCQSVSEEDLEPDIPEPEEESEPPEQYECRGEQSIKNLNLGEVVHTCSNPKRHCRITESGTVPKCCGKFIGYFINCEGVSEEDLEPDIPEPEEGYSCFYIWPQGIKNKTSGENVEQCPLERPYCNLAIRNTPQCCKRSGGQYTDCKDVVPEFGCKTSGNQGITNARTGEVLYYCPEEISACNTNSIPDNPQCCVKVGNNYVSCKNMMFEDGEVIRPKYSCRVISWPHEIRNKTSRETIHTCSETRPHCNSDTEYYDPQCCMLQDNQFVNCIGIFEEEQVPQEEVEAYACAWTWPQSIKNRDTGTVHYACTSGKPYCNTDTVTDNPQCCKKSNGEYTDCTEMVEKYSCFYIWPQGIKNKTSGENVEQCPIEKPYCNLKEVNNPRCCRKQDGVLVDCEKAIKEYTCVWTWPQAIKNKNTGEVVHSCPVATPYCNINTVLTNPQCCLKVGNRYLNCESMSE